MPTWVQKIRLWRSIRRAGLPLDKRWQLAGEPRPKAEWHSFDRTPWKHPWMSKDNIRQFAEFSKLQLSRVQDHVERAKSQRKQGRFAFVGNMANVNYIRALPLRRRGLNVDLILHPQDDFPFAQPAWEEFDGEITELGDNPSKVFSEAKLPNWAYRHREAADWARFPLNTMVATPRQVLLWPEYMAFLPTLSGAIPLRLAAGFAGSLSRISLR